MSLIQLLIGVSIGVTVLFLLLHYDAENHPERVKEHEPSNHTWWILAAAGVVLLFVLNKGFRERFVTWVEDKLNIHHESRETSEDAETLRARKTRTAPKQETPPSAETAYQGKPDMHGRVEATEEDLKHWTANNPDVKVVSE